jgi:hypothetical protein
VKYENCLTWAWRKFRAEGGYIAFRFVGGLPRFYWAASIEGYYRRPLHRYRVPWNILAHRGRIERET